MIASLAPQLITQAAHVKVDRETGVVVAPEPAALAQACAYLAAHVDEAKAWGVAGKAVAERVTWDACIDALLG